MCSGLGRGSVLELQLSSKEFYGNHVGRGAGLLLCRVNDGITGFHKPQRMLMDISGFFIQNLHSSSALDRHPQLLVCESQLVILIVYRWSYEVVSCCVTNTEFNGSIHVVVYISASLKLEKSETGRYNFLEVEAVAEHSKQKLPAGGQKNPRKGDLS